MKKFMAVFMAAAVLLSLAACGDAAEQRTSGAEAVAEEAFGDSRMQEASAGEQETTQAPAEVGEADDGPSTAEEAAPEDGGTEPETGSGLLVAYFTYGENAGLPEGVDASASASIQIYNGAVTGNTGVVAHRIAEATGGDLFSIRTVEPYPDSYDETVDLGQAEKNDGVYPELSTHIENLDQYDVIFLGFPNWWYGMPMVMYSFLEEYDFAGKTIVPFVTSGGSGFSDAISEIEQAEPDAVVLEGLSIGASRSAEAEDEILEWLRELGYAE